MHANNASGLSSCMYGLRYQCRALCAFEGNTEVSQFLVGTFNAHEENEIHLIEYEEENNEFKRKEIFRHPEEIYSLASSPHRPSLISSLSVPQREKLFHTKLFQINGEQQKTGKSTDGGVSSLECVVDVPATLGRPRQILFHPVDADKFLIVEDSGAKLMALDTAKSAASLVQITKPYSSYNCACFDPHHSSILVSACSSDLRVWDFRQSSVKESHTISNAHRGMIRDLDYNPNKPYHFISGGEDRTLHVWDLRKCKVHVETIENSPEEDFSPSLDSLRQLQGHTHWIWSVEYNRFHDQLILSACSEEILLWNLVSVSSAPLGELEWNADGRHEKDSDKLIKSFQEHEESIYSAVWSAADAWAFASLSYDGRVVLNHVPTAEKYKILL